MATPFTPLKVTSQTLKVLTTCFPSLNLYNPPLPISRALVFRRAINPESPRFFSTFLQRLGGTTPVAPGSPYPPCRVLHSSCYAATLPAVSVEAPGHCDVSQAHRSWGETLRGHGSSTSPSTMPTTKKRSPAGYIDCHRTTAISRVVDADSLSPSRSILGREATEGGIL